MHNLDAIEVLLVEDNDSDAELTQRALKQSHFSNQIRRFSDGQEVLDYLLPPNASPETEAHPGPKLILLDMKLPKVNGLEVLKILKSDPRTRTISVVILTSSTEDQDIFDCYQLGVNSYIVKPVEFDKFNQAIQAVGFYWLLLNKFPNG